MKPLRPRTVVLSLLAFFAGPRFCTVVWAALVCIAVMLASRELTENARARRGR